MNDPSIVESVFLAALEKATDESRSAFLDDACKDNPGLREQVSCLLAAHPKAVRFMGQPAALAKENTAAYVPTEEQVGTIVAGRYKLLEMIGEGGMGEVWVADQLEPIRRRVALKLIKPGMDSRSVLARFDAERQALALMDHPNIAKVLDAGTTADGRPYFVMELVKGTPITEFCDTRKLSPRERLDLFVPVCQAIQHAHTKGIIHRDIKPSNVLVALHDEQPVPKVIDFGVAKAMGQQLTEKTIYTGFGGLVGTPAYMAPEQATFNQLDIDTRADVYALGVLLYELLAGSPPVEPERLKKAALDEVLRLVREEEPPRPSQRLSTSQSRASIAAVRQTDPIKLSKLIQGELDWIVMKALEKDRTRRYDTANGFAADVQRYLNGETVLAHPPSTAYRLNKFVRKHRGRVLAATAFVMLLFMASIVSSWLAVQAKRAEAAAESRRIEADENARRADYNAGKVQGAVMAANEARIEAEGTALSLLVDVHLKSLSNNPQAGLLRLCRTRKEIDGKLKQFGTLDTMLPTKELVQPIKTLGEFLTAAVIATGQDYAPLLPPITHAGSDILRRQVSPDRLTILTEGRDGRVGLWDTRTARLIATLREDNERVIHCGYSPDGRTAFTADWSGVARIWDIPAGSLRAKTEPRPQRYKLPKAAADGQYPVDDGLWQQVSNATTICGNRLLTKQVVVNTDNGASRAVWSGPVELWDTTNGRLIGRLDQPGYSVEHFSLLTGVNWITTTEGASTVLVFAAGDGRLVARLQHPAGEPVFQYAASPGSKFIATLARPTGKHPTLRLWDAASWSPVFTHADISNGSSLLYWSDELVGVATFDFGYSGLSVYGPGRPAPLYSMEYDAVRISPSGEYLLKDRDQVYDARTGLRQNPPKDRKYPPTLSQFADDGRFVPSVLSKQVGIETRFTTELIDTVTEKSLIFSESKVDIRGDAGFLAATQLSGGVLQVRYVPTAYLKDIPAEWLELWAQVVVRGELGDDGTIRKWDEKTWERKRQELAGFKPLRPGIPFPGHVATDKLHWLRAEYFATTDEAEKQRLAKDLLRRAEANGDDPEAVRWRAILARTVDQEAKPIAK